MMNRRIATLMSAMGIVGALALIPASASAQQVVVERTYVAEERNVYPLEVEPHFAFGADNVYGNAGYGAGVRIGIPFAYGHLGRVPQNLAIDFGADLLHYENCYYGQHCQANYFIAPVALQWNVFVARPVSVFGEAGVFVYKGWFDACRPGEAGCDAPPDLGLLPTLALGARIHLARDVSLTARLGYPTSTIGVSFL